MTARRGAQRTRAAVACALLAGLAGAPAARAESVLLAPRGGPPDGDARIRTLRRAREQAAARQAGADDDLRQVLVLPERPGRNNVRYYDFEWKRWDFLQDRGVGGVRFYFYEREEEIARIAAALVRTQYELLAKRFNYRPTARVPYILYNSHREFENTNVFFVNEYVLGVTSPQDLRMALPYWGEIERFREVSTHEMAHQFTIQKVADRAAALGLESPIHSMPLWFIEGLAEYYAKNGVDLETDAFARDLLVEPRPERNYTLWGFWEDEPKGYIPTYKLGQLRVAFLADAYGERIVQGVLDQSPRLGSGARGGGPASADREDFKALVARLAGEKPADIAQRFAAWMKRRYLPEYLATRQEPPLFAPVELAGEPDAFAAARDGYTLLYRTVERDTGRARLRLVDRRAPDSDVQVAVDGQPGVESLHPVLRGVAAVTADRLAFFARDGSADSLYVAPYRRTGEGAAIRLRVGPRARIDLSDADLIEAGDPAFSPAGDRLVFFGLDGTGRMDLWTVGADGSKLSRLTSDLYAERDPVWTDEAPEAWGVDTGGAQGPHEGTIVYASDETADRRYNLFALDPRTGARARLTDEPADHRSPAALGGGLVVFATDARGKQDLHLYSAKERRITRLTDFVTMLTAPHPGPRGLMALGFFGGRYRIFDVPSEALLAVDERPAVVGVPEPPAPFPAEPIPPEVEAYKPFTVKNWRLENGAAAIGAAAAGQVGQGALLFGDVLGDRSVLVQLGIYGSLSLTDALAFYVDRSGRTVWGGGPFHTFTQRRETEAPGFDTDVLYLQREFGATALWSYPFDTFSRLELRGTVQGESREFQGLIDRQGFLDLAVPLAKLRRWEADRGGLDLEGLGAVRLGYDTTRYRFPGGAFGGGSVLVEGGGGWLPLRSALHVYATLDAQWHRRFLGWPTLHLRAAAGTSGGSVFARQFFLSSYDNLRQYVISDRRLLGSSYAVANADLEFPLDMLVRLALFSTISGVVGADFGSVTDRLSDLWPTRTLGFVLGFNLGLGPFEIRVHFSKPVDVGGIRLPSDWVPNISLRYLYF